MTFKPWLLCVCLLVLSGCGTERTFFTDQAARLAGLLSARGETGPGLRTRLTPEALAALNQPLLIVELDNIGAEAGAQLQRVAGRLETWGTLNGVQFTFENGVLISTRGVPGDLMSSDLRNMRAVFAARGGEGVRVNRYLDGEDQEVSRALVCTLRRAGREQISVQTGTYTTQKLTEACVSTSDRVENHYWIDARGLVRQSVQWIGPNAGYLRTERIND